jgi:hypothetical protein
LRAAFGQDPASRLHAHPAGAADDQQLLALELIAHLKNSFCKPVDGQALVEKPA